MGCDGHSATCVVQRLQLQRLRGNYAAHRHGCRSAFRAGDIAGPVCAVSRSVAEPGPSTRNPCNPCLSLAGLKELLLSWGLSDLAAGVAKEWRCELVPTAADDAEALPHVLAGVPVAVGGGCADDVFDQVGGSGLAFLREVPPLPHLPMCMDLAPFSQPATATTKHIASFCRFVRPNRRCASATLLLCMCLCPYRTLPFRSHVSVPPW